MSGCEGGEKPGRGEVVKLSRGLGEVAECTSPCMIGKNTRGSRENSSPYVTGATKDLDFRLRENARPRDNEKVAWRRENAQPCDSGKG